MIYSFLFLCIAMTYFFIGFFSLNKNEKDLNNRLFFAVVFLFAIWALMYSYLYMIKDAETAAYVRRFTVISWGLVYSIMLHFAIRISSFNNLAKKLYQKALILFVVYFPALINLYLYLGDSYKSEELELTNHGWIVSPIYDRGYIWDNFFFAQYSVALLLTIGVLLYWNRTTNVLRERKQARYLLIAFAVPFVLGSIVDILLPLNGISIVVNATLIIAIIPMLLIYYAIEKFGLLNFDTEIVASQVMNITNEGVIICDLTGKIEKINQGALTLLNFDKEDDLENVIVFGIDVKKTHKIYSQEIDLLTKSNDTIHVLLTTKEITDSMKEAFGYLLVFQDLTALRETQDRLKKLNNSLEDKIVKRTVELSELNAELLSEVKVRMKAEESIKEMAYRDHLTGLYNRRYYEDSLKEFDKEEFYPLTIVMADINGLKLINDAFGHNEGDNLLINAAKIIKKECRKEDIVTRIGGDEFVIIMPNADDETAEKIINTINKEAKKIQIHTIELSISFGYRTKIRKTDNIQEIYRNAEDLMYREKLIKIPSMRSGAIETILNTLYQKDAKSEIHSRSVSLLSENIAIACKMNRQEISEVKTAGLLHDIGKILVPKNIINKKGKLNYDEFEVMKTHPEIGFRILNSSQEMRSISNIVLNHHEKWDGTGYPIGVKGENIPKTARIIAVADTFDAMTTERSYRQKVSKKDALKEILKYSGTQFDPEIVKIFKANFEEITKI